VDCAFGFLASEVIEGWEW